jgi:F-type H+-transporting ATPase subunit b
MIIDWFTVGAQTLNFILLVWLLKHFLYQPILDMIDAREKLIAQKIDHADAVSIDADQAKAEFQQKNQKLDQRRDTLMHKATIAAEKEGERLLECARKTATELGARREQAIENKLQQLHESIRDVVQHEVFSMTKNALLDLADSRIEDQIIKLFIERLREMTAKQKATLQAAIKCETNSKVISISVQSSVKIPAKQQFVITQLLEKLLDESIHPTFNLSPELIGGITLDAQGFKIGWSIAEYLYSMESALNKLVENNSLTANKTNFNDKNVADKKSAYNKENVADEDRSIDDNISSSKQSHLKTSKTKKQSKVQSMDVKPSKLHNDDASRETSPILTRYESEHNSKDSFI